MQSVHVSIHQLHIFTILGNADDEEHVCFYLRR
jgi:hypothetical protein